MKSFVLLIPMMLLAAGTGVALAQSPATPLPDTDEPAAPGESAEPVFPAYSLYADADTGAYVKPILQIAGGVEHQFSRNPVREEASGVDFGDRLTTYAVARFGFEGSAGHGVTFKLELQRDPGTFGTGVWEGTAAMSSREMWAKLERYGAGISVGIIQDPASVDYFSVHIGDTLVTDRYSRNPLLFSGFNRGQGVLAQYDFSYLASALPLTVAMSYTSCNPLASSTSFPFGGNVSNIGDLNYIPRGAMTDGNPGSSDTEMQLYTPSVTYENELSDAFSLALRGAVQLYRVYLDKSNTANESLGGHNVRGSVRLGFAREMFAVFGGASFRENNTYESDEASGTYDYTRISSERFKANTFSGGLDFTYDKLFGIGGGYTLYEYKLHGIERSMDFINVGASLFVTEALTVGLRRAYLITRTDGEWDDGTADFASWFLGMRLMI